MGIPGEEKKNALDFKIDFLKIKASSFLSGIFFAGTYVHMPVLVPGIHKKWHLMHRSGYWTL